MPGDIRKLPAWEFNALCDYMPVMEAERNIALADLIFTFAQTPQDKAEIKRQSKRRERYIRNQQRTIKKIRDLYSDKQEEIIAEIEIEPPKRADLSKLNDDQKQKLRDWAKSIGAVVPDKK